MDIINTFENVFDSVVYGIDNPSICYNLSFKIIIMMK